MVKRIYFSDLNKLVNDLLGCSEELVVRWWLSPNKAFNNETPFSTYLSSPEKVRGYLMYYLQK